MIMIMVIMMITKNDNDDNKPINLYINPECIHVTGTQPTYLTEVAGA